MAQKISRTFIIGAFLGVLGFALLSMSFVVNLTVGTFPAIGFVVPVGLALLSTGVFIVLSSSNIAQRTQ